MISDNMTAIELVDKAVQNRTCFKIVSPKLEALPPDKTAANKLISAYRAGKSPPWLTAHLLGCVGHSVGYATAKQILLDGPGQSAESYAGVAMAKIRGTESYADLREILANGEQPKMRRGAAHGLAHRREPDVIPTFIEGYAAKRLPLNDVSWHVAHCGPDDSVLISLLKSSDSRLQRLGCKTVETLLWSDGGFSPPGDVVKEPARALLSDSSLPFSKKWLKRLCDWTNVDP